MEKIVYVNEYFEERKIQEMKLFGYALAERHKGDQLLYLVDTYHPKFDYPQKTDCVPYLILRFEKEDIFPNSEKINALEKKFYSLKSPEKSSYKWPIIITIIGAILASVSLSVIFIPLIGIAWIFVMKLFNDNKLITLKKNNEVAAEILNEIKVLNAERVTSL